MGKQPAIMFYVGDYLKDTRHLSLEAKGAWTDLLWFMFHAEQRGQITLPIDGFSRLLGAGQEQTIRVLNELVATRVCDCLINGAQGDMSPFCPPNVPACPLNVTIINRRMAKEEKQRDYNRLKKQKQRSSKVCPENVKPLLSSSSSSSFSNNELLRNSARSEAVPHSRPASAATIEICPTAANGESPASYHERYMVWATSLIRDYVTIHRNQLELAYPGIDLDQQAAMSIAWLQANPGKRKRDVRRFVTNWLARAQEYQRPTLSGERVIPLGASKTLDQMIAESKARDDARLRKG